MARCEEKVVRAPLSVDGGVRMEVRFLLYLPPSSPKNFTAVDGHNGHRSVVYDGRVSILDVCVGG